MKDDSPIHILWLPTILIAGIAYVVSMIDLIPGFGIGWIDDLIVVIALIWFFTTWLPKNRHRIYWFRPPPHSGAGADNKKSGSMPGPDPRTTINPFDTLKVQKGATADEIKRAYKEMLSKYHPDKVAHLGEELQQKAHEKAIEIKRAYEILCGKG
jgi:hypothetical protein